MSHGTARLGIGARLVYDGEAVEVVEFAATGAGNEVVLKDCRGRMLRVSVKELLFSARATVVPEEPGACSGDVEDVASVVLSRLDRAEQERVADLVGHVREVRFGYWSGSSELPAPGEPRPEYDPGLPKMTRYAAKARELDVSVRTIKRWMAAVEERGAAGLAPRARRTTLLDRLDPRWVETALEVMVEHTDQSKPQRNEVIERTRARLVARFGEGAVDMPGRSKAYEALEALERQHPTFRLSTKRNRDIAGRPREVFGRLRPTRPGEYLLMDTTRLDVFALDPVTLRWINCELTVVMDWYTRCIVGIRLTPVSTKAVDAAAALFQAYRPLLVAAHWPPEAVWPEHGIPRSVLIDPSVIDGPMVRAAGPALVPETVVIDHGKIYVSEHLRSVCARMGISIQPVRLRTGRDKGPVERFFKTLREGLLHALPGYKGPDLFSRGEAPEREAFYYIDELFDRIRQWVAATYHLTPHSSLVDPAVPGLRMSPAQMFEHGMARAGYIEVPRDRFLALEFLETKWRTIQPYGVEIDGRRYNGPGLYLDGRPSPYLGGKWPIQVNPDDIDHAYFRDLDRTWHQLDWEHAASRSFPLSEDALEYGRKLAATKHPYPNDRLAVSELLERWQLGLGMTLAERRIALRAAREQIAFTVELDKQAPRELVRESADIGGDDDAADADDFEGGVLGEDAELDEESFYADALEDL
ncbi:transposase [Nonomuraea sp. NN258]|uniref:helix-turn-helix domain-containing protein n=1 Tax=Nonomuraea antri TaxID=2730852 RepID=UPI00156A593A|nr:helix-turn-helix domain-containing protein [Nonomuraea antri]NRQ32729.1 transposase [Nonomuraea antri]